MSKKNSSNLFKLIFFPKPNEVENVYDGTDRLINKFLPKNSSLKKFLSPGICIYLLVGGITTFANLGVYYLLYFMCQCPPDDSFLIQVINAIAWLVAVIACFFPNKFYVFRSVYQNPSHTWKEFLSFVASRLATLVLETVSLYICCTLLSFSALIVKPFVAILVVVANYVLGKLLVFSKGKKQ